MTWPGALHGGSPELSKRQPTKHKNVSSGQEPGEISTRAQIWIARGLKANALRDLQPPKWDATPIHMNIKPSAIGELHVEDSAQSNGQYLSSIGHLSNVSTIGPTTAFLSSTLGPVHTMPKSRGEAFGLKTHIKIIHWKPLASHSVKPKA